MFETILKTTDVSIIPMPQALICMGTALILGLIISICYMCTQKKGSYTKDFAIALTILPAVVAIVIILVGSNVARAFSIAGAFALVRFRSAPGSAKDISIVFFTMAAGLACGLGYVTFAAAFTAVMLLLLILISALGFVDRNEGRKQLKIVIPESLNYNSVFDDLFDKYTSENRLNKVKTTNMGTMYELTYEIRLKNDDAEKDFIDELRVRNGNLNISVGIMPENSVSALN